MNQSKGEIFYDGLCILCSSEINHYRAQRGSEKFDFVDITAAGFSPEANGLDPRKVHRVMHVRDSTGKLHEGVDAFRTIWSELPRYRLLASLSTKPLVRAGLEIGYRLFVHARPYLPRRKNIDCSASPYCEVPK